MGMGQNLLLPYFGENNPLTSYDFVYKKGTMVLTHNQIVVLMGKWVNVILNEHIIYRLMSE